MKVLVLGLLVFSGFFAQASVMSVVSGITVRQVPPYEGEYKLVGLGPNAGQQSIYKICDKAPEFELTHDTLAQSNGERFTIELLSDLKSTCIYRALIEKNM